jgi:predicted nucleic acid-binding Zn ribbon protein
MGRLCAYCLAPLANGRSICSDECAAGLFKDHDNLA